ncbi:MAG: alpha-galactosidase [Clostridia bacterium]|nr:alpha-galactosidase [Clostridia bacterium]
MKKLLANRKLFSITLALVMLFTAIASISVSMGNINLIPVKADSAIAREYKEMTLDLENLPINFVYGDKYFSGFSPKYFVEEYRTSRPERNGVLTTIQLRHEDIVVNIETGFYEEYNAYDYTVYFKNVGSSNSKVFKYLNAIDMNIEGGSPRLKGIWGDKTLAGTGGDYAPYDYDLTQTNVGFMSTNGRPTHGVFPYFNLENANGGAMFAIGWGGTWEATFKYDASTNSTNFTGLGTRNLKTYLKPGEEIRTPLIAVLRYYERDEDLATNAWRKWMVDCNIPREGDTEDPMEPIRMVQISNDTGKPNSDGSISEDYTTWERSLRSYYEHGLTADYRWFDAGWYISPDNQTVPSAWYGTVGTWTIDHVKWPGDTFKQSVDYAKVHGTGTMVWFEPERVTNISALVANFGYNAEWAIASGSNNMNNLGNPAALAWTKNKILTFMKTHGVSMYREDFNCDPYSFWDNGDTKQGANRRGITENLYMQGHYELWDSIITWQKANGGAGCVDSCASGGGRNDLETMRRAIINLRSDSDRTTIDKRLSMTSTLSKWLPLNGTITAEKSSELANGIIDIYAIRGSLLCSTVLNIKWYHDADNGIIDWETLRKGEAEWKEGSKYLLKEFYTLTPYRGVAESTSWTAWEYYDPDTDSAFVQAFRQKSAEASTYTINLKAISDNKYYSVRDVDGTHSQERVLGSTLKQGLTLSASAKRTAISLYITPVA